MKHNLPTIVDISDYPIPAPGAGFKVGDLVRIVSIFPDEAGNNICYKRVHSYLRENGTICEVRKELYKNEQGEYVVSIKFDKLVHEEKVITSINITPFQLELVYEKH